MFTVQRIYLRGSQIPKLDMNIQKYYDLSVISIVFICIFLIKPPYIEKQGNSKYCFSNWAYQVLI